MYSCCEFILFVKGFDVDLFVFCTFSIFLLLFDYRNESAAMKTLRQPMSKCSRPRTETFLLSMIILALVLSIYRYSAFVTTFQTVTFANRIVTSFQTVTFANNSVPATVVFHGYLNASWSNEKRTKSDTNKTDEATNSTIQNISYLINSENTCSEVSDSFVVALVHTAIGNFERRNFIRNTWGNISMFENKKIRLVFLLGKPEKKQYQSAINFENKQYNDIVQGAFLDTYQNLTYKALLGLRWVVENCGQAKFILKVDDDVVVNTPRLLKILTTKYSHIKHSIFCAQIRPKGMSRIFRYGKYKVEQTMFPNMTHWPVKYCPGRFLVYSSDIIKDLLAAVRFTPFLWLDDVYVTGLLASKVGYVKHLLFQDVSGLIEWLENAKTAQFLRAWNRFLQ